jgi:hypothetical protein
VRVLLYSLIIIVIAPGVRAQVEMDGTRRIQPSLDRRFNAALLAASPGSVRETIPAPTAPRAQQPEYMSWRLEDHSVVSIDYYVTRTAQGAEQLLLEMQSTIAVKNVAVDSPGDRAFLISPNTAGVEKLLFRRGRIVLLVRARITKNVKRFAAIFDAQVQRSIRAGEIDEQ